MPKKGWLLIACRWLSRMCILLNIAVELHAHEDSVAFVQNLIMSADFVIVILKLSWIFHKFINYECKRRSLFPWKLSWMYQKISKYESLKKTPLELGVEETSVNFLVKNIGRFIQIVFFLTSVILGFKQMYEDTVDIKHTYTHTPPQWKHQCNEANGNIHYTNLFSSILVHSPSFSLSSLHF